MQPSQNASMKRPADLPEPQIASGIPLDSSTFDELDKIAARKGLRVYRDMQYDEQIKFCLLAKKMMVLAPGWRIDPNPKEPHSQMHVDFVIDALSKTERTFEKILYDLLSAFDYGFSVGELLWTDKVMQDRITLRNIKTVFPWDVEFVYLPTGELDYLKVGLDELEPNKLVIYSYLDQFGDKKGVSDLKSAYNAWWFKSNIWKFWSRHLERFGSPVVKGRIPPGATPDESNRFFAMINRLHNIVGVMLPRTKSGESFDFELVESKREGGQQFVAAIENADSRIARSMLIPRLFGATKESFGSYALGSKQFDFVSKSATFVAKDFADDVVNRQIIRKLVAYNFRTENPPRFVFNKIDDSMLESVLEELRAKGKEIDDEGVDGDAGRSRGQPDADDASTEDQGTKP